jgi:hypothetical protein
MGIGIAVYQLYFSKNVADVKAGKQLMNELNNSLALSTNAHTHNEQEDYGYDIHMIEAFQSVDQTLNFFTTTLMEENEEYFASMFLPDKLSQALFSYSDDPSSENIRLKMIQEINRNGRLTEVQWKTHLTEDKKFSRDDTNVDVTFIYSDGKKVTVRLDFVLIGTEHFTEKIYYVQNSPKEIIEEIQKKTK